MAEINENDEAFLEALHEADETQVSMRELGRIIREELDDWDSIPNKIRNYRANKKFNVDGADRLEYRIVSVEKRNGTTEDNVPRSKLVIIEDEEKLDRLVSKHLEEDDSDKCASAAEVEEMRRRFNAIVEVLIEKTELDKDEVYEEMQVRLKQ